uniref:B0414F07.3 protein n=1 Tax=Oryza sativa TaxID=4530 RepID=Q259Y5_ORYSA|nr:B0414F07.3 [Oryza sativa]
MDLNMTNLWFHGKEHIAASPFPQVATSMNFTCLGSSKTIEASKKMFQQSNQSLSIPDDGCRLVLGLGPTPNLHYADNESSGGNRDKESANLFSQHFAIADHGLKLGISRGGTRNFQATTMIEKYSHQNRNGIVFPLTDEGSTSAKRKPGGYVLPLLFAPRSDDICPNGTPPVTDIQHVETVDDDDDDHITSLNQQKVRISPEPSATTDCSFAATSDMIFSSTSTEQRSHQRHPKKCRFNGCSKGARGATGLCISHGGGQRCQKPGCNKGAESRTANCKSHGGGKRCQELGCTKSAEGKTEFCIAHGGGRRCGTLGCTKAARGRSGFCIKHGGGKRCRVEGCSRSAEGQFGLCISHGGGRRCQYPNCSKGAQGGTMFCKSHGGGKRCIFEGCTKGAEGNTLLCKGHGGGKRCLFEGGGVCPKSVHGGTSFCVAHGGGKRCSVPGCTKSARGRTDCCVRHGGGKRCKVDGCDKSAQGSTDFCKAHGGGKRCAWSTGCERFARGRSGLCAAHGTLMASKQVPESEHSRGMIRNSLFSKMVSASSMTAGASMDHAISSSLPGASSDRGESLEEMRNAKLLIPHQVLVPGSMRPSSSHGKGQEDGGSQEQQCFGFVVPEGRVHGGGLMSMLGAGGNLDDPKA